MTSLHKVLSLKRFGLWDQVQGSTRLPQNREDRKEVFQHIPLRSLYGETIKYSIFGGKLDHVCECDPGLSDALSGEDGLCSGIHNTFDR